MAHQPISRGAPPNEDKRAAMLTFHPLELQQRTRIAEDAVCLELRPPPGLEAAYGFQAGQYLVVRATIAGREVRRTYSIASAVGGALRIGVRVQGEMSRYLAEGLPVGGRLEALEPAGGFGYTLDAASSKSYAAFAAGSGITPIVSIVGTLLGVEPKSRVLLIYANRSMARTMFLDELLALQARYPSRLTLHLLTSRERQDSERLSGRLDAAKLRTLAHSEFDPRAIDAFFLCGPGEAAGQWSATLRDLGAAGRIHAEHFTIERLDAATAVPPGLTAVILTRDGQRHTFQMPRDVTILTVTKALGLGVPYSCRGGVCAVCRVRVIEGTVATKRNKALEPGEVQAGYVLACEAKPASERLEITREEA